MKAMFVAASFAVAALVSHTAYADAPAGSTALCKDGSYYSGKSKRGACSGHEGIQDWYGAKGATPAAAPATPATATTAAAPATAATDTPAETKKKHKKKDADTATAATPAAAPATPAAVAPTPAAAPATAAPAEGTAMKHKAPTPAKDIVQKPGGGAGLVWVNSSSKVYHCEGDEWYGKTKEGSYMSEAAAKTAGAHGSGNKDCAAAK